jgi:hypothetical protein
VAQMREIGKCVGRVSRVQEMVYGVGVGEGRDGVVGRCPGLVSYFLYFFKEIDVGSRRV